jgi:hypothetical protein
MLCASQIATLSKYPRSQNVSTGLLASYGTRQMRFSLSATKQLVAVDSALHCLPAHALVNVLVLVWVSGPQVLDLDPQLVRQRWVIPPASLHNNGTGRGIHYEPLVRVVRLQLGVEADPDFRAGLADRWYHRAPGLLRDVLGLFDPEDVRTFQRLDVMYALVAQAVKR